MGQKNGGKEKNQKYKKILTKKSRKGNIIYFIVILAIFVFAGVAQSVEQLICNQPVAGSSPIASSWRGSRVAKGNRL